jgi:DNA-binding transcriptional MerR regulator
MAIDTLKVAKRLREAGFTEPQAEAVIAAVQDGTEGADLATKGDLNEARTALKVEIAELRAELKTEIAELRAELKTEIAELRAELKAEIADLRSELRQAELRLEAKIEAIKADILNRIFGLILGTLGVNIVAIVGAMFAVAKLVGH